LKVLWALAGASMFCSLEEQFEDQVRIDCFRGMLCNCKFLAILNKIKQLTGDELVEFDNFLHYMLVVGPSQAPS
jgi:hypothetical protein